MMRMMLSLPVAVAALALLGGCASHNAFGRQAGPDEMAVTREPPLVIPPDFALSPPPPGTAAAQESSVKQEALQAMFGGPAPRSATETSILKQAGDSVAEAGIRSTAGSTETKVIDKGQTTQDIISAPQGDGQDAKAEAGK